MMSPCNKLSIHTLILLEAMPEELSLLFPSGCIGLRAFKTTQLHSFSHFGMIYFRVVKRSFKNSVATVLTPYFVSSVVSKT